MTAAQYKNQKRTSTRRRDAESPAAETLLVGRVPELHSDRDQIALARSVCHRLVSLWWHDFSSGSSKWPLRALFEDRPLRRLPVRTLREIDSVAESFSELQPEAVVYQIGLIYTRMLPSKYRAEYGVYYTPPPLVERLINQATIAGTDWTSCRVLDPACGGGAFLAPVARKILSALPNVTPAILVRNIATRLKGFEIDPFAAWLSQVTIDAVMLDVCKKAKRRLPVVVTVCDTLKRSAPRERFDLVIGNPPYGRIKLEAEERARFKRSLFGHANLYGLFTDQALRHVCKGGVVAYVTPTSFLAGEYFKNLRALLGRFSSPVTFDFVGSRKGVFEDVLQETLLATYRYKSPKVVASVNEILPTEGNALRVVETGSFSVPEDAAEPWLLSRTPEQAQLVECLHAFKHRLSDWGYKVSTGPLVWNRHKSQLRSAPSAKRYPLIWAESITPDGEFMFRAEKKNHEPYFEPGEKDDWLITREPCVLLQRTTSKEQTRRLIAASLPASFLKQHAAVVIENHINMLRPIVKRPKVTPSVLSVFLNSLAADRAFRCISGSVAVSAYELEALPLPSPDSLKPLSNLIRKRASRALIEAECERLFEKRQLCNS